MLNVSLDLCNLIFFLISAHYSNFMIPSQLASGSQQLPTLYKRLTDN